MSKTAWYVPYFYEQKIKPSIACEKIKIQSLVSEKDTFALYTVHVRLTIEYQLTQNFHTDLIVQITLNQCSTE